MVTTVNPREDYAVYYPEDGQYSVPMTLKEARHLVRQFTTAWIVNLRTAEVFG